MSTDRDLPPIETVLWDYGGVFTPSPFHAMTSYASELGVPSDRLLDLVLGYSVPDGDHPWHRVERGELALSDAIDEIRANASDEPGMAEFEMRGFFGAMRSDDDGAARQAVFDAVARLRDVGVTNVVVSNNVKEFAQHWLAVLPEGLFDDVIDSSAVGVRKPDAAIFRLALERAGQPDPERVAFLDDYIGNIDAANALGIHGILVGPNPMDAVAQLARRAGLD